jgi:ribonuclease Y
MSPILIALLALVTGAAAGAAIGYYVHRQQMAARAAVQEVQTRAAVQEAENNAQAVLLKARDEALKIKDQAEAEAARRLGEFNKEDQRLTRRREELDRKMEQVDQRRTQLDRRQSLLDKREGDLNKMEADRRAELQRISGMTQEEAKAVLMAAVEKEARGDMARIVRQIEEEAKAEGDRRARKIIAVSIQRIASEHVQEISVSAVPLPSDEMKGRIIGRNGRNIRAFEQAAGVDVVVDDTPEAVTISSFDSVRREIARRSMEKLVLDGRIHPAHIEKTVDQARQDVEKTIV